MVIANLDKQVEQAFGLSSVKDKAARPIEARDAARAESNRIATENQFVAPPHAASRARPDGDDSSDHDLDDAGLPVWLL